MGGLVIFDMHSMLVGTFPEKCKITAIVDSSLVDTFILQVYSYSEYEN